MKKLFVIALIFTMILLTSSSKNIKYEVKQLPDTTQVEEFEDIILEQFKQEMQKQFKQELQEQFKQEIIFDEQIFKLDSILDIKQKEEEDDDYEEIRT